ncbi:MAG: hypothetical protein ABIF18_02580 [archaeon]
MIDIQEKKKKIISFLETNGPSLPVRIAKAIEMEPVVASAITSELLDSKQVKTSHMKIGASSLYLLPGQEQKLEEHIDNLKSAEKEVFLKLKDKKLMEDENEEPVTRVALRNIKDFAIPLKFQEKIKWKYAFATEEEIEKLLHPKETPKEEPETIDKKLKSITEEAEKEAEKEEHTEVPKAWEVKKKEIEQIKKESKKVESIFVPLKSENKEPAPEFLIEIKNFLKKKNIKFIEEIRTEKKEIMAVINITSQLGDINFLMVAKNKKTATKDEIEAAIQIATKNKMPCLLIIKGKPSKPIQKFIEENHLIKLEVM